MLSLDALMTAPVILTASASWAFGVFGSMAWHGTADWRMLRRHRRRMYTTAARVAAAEPRWSLRPPMKTISADQAVPVRVRENRKPESAPTESMPPPIPRLAAQQSAALAVAPALTAAPLCESMPPAPPDVVPAGVFDQLPPPQRRAVPHLLMSPANHLIEFLEWQRDCALGRNPKTGRWECRRSSADMLLVYHRWAKARALAVIAESEFLRRLTDAPGIEKSRDRIKDADGRVLRNANGTPLRSVFYTIVELPPEAVRSAAPGRRPAGVSGAAKHKMDEATRRELLAQLEREPERVRRAA